MDVGIQWSYVWKKPEYPEETTDLGQATTTLPHADTGDQTQVPVVTSVGFTPAPDLFNL